MKTKKPVNPSYPEKLITLGDHLRKVRLDRGLSQSDVAKIIGATTDTITGWELRRHCPTIKFAKSIIQFLGYFPFNLEDCSVGSQLYFARLISGMTQRQVASHVGCDESNLRHIELDKRMPRNTTLMKIMDFIDTTLLEVTQNKA